MAETAVLEQETGIDTSVEDTSRVYEIGYHIVSTKKEDELEPTVAKIRSMIEKAGGKFLAEGAPTLQRLSYLISTKEKGKRVDHDRGYFGWLKFEAGVEPAAGLERGLRDMEEILRSVLFKTVREETRARFKTQGIREVRRGDVLRAPARKEEVSVPVSEADLEKAIQDITAE